MCGRATLVVGTDEIREVFGVEDVPTMQPRYNLAPLQPILITRTLGTLEQFTWGVRGPRPFINSRIEVATKRPELRCLVVVDGFFEWGGAKPDRRAYRFRRPDRMPFAIGGVTRSEVPTAALVTTAAQVEMVDLHDRQPVVLRREEWEPWLAGETIPGTLGELVRDPVSDHVNNWRHDDPACIEPVAQHAIQLRLV